MYMLFLYSDKELNSIRIREEASAEGKEMEKEEDLKMIFQLK